MRDVYKLASEGCEKGYKLNTKRHVTEDDSVSGRCGKELRATVIKETLHKSHAQNVTVSSVKTEEYWGETSMKQVAQQNTNSSVTMPAKQKNLMPHTHQLRFYRMLFLFLTLIWQEVNFLMFLPQFYVEVRVR